MTLKQSINDRDYDSFVETAQGDTAIRTQGGRVNTTYDNAEFSVSNGTSDYDVSSNESDAFSNVATAGTVSIRTDVTITVKLNDSGNPGITITSTDSPFDIDTVEVTNLFISNSSGGPAAVKVFLS